jgi:hypothetical protein
LEARLWNSTFVEDYAYGINQIRLISKARLILDPSIMQRNTTDDIAFVSATKVDTILITIKCTYVFLLFCR